MTKLNRITSWIIRMSETRYGPSLLFLAAFLESIVSVSPLTFLFMVLAVASPKRSFRFALLCTFGATLGAMLAYGIGYFSWIKTNGEFTAVANFFFEYVPGFSLEKYYEIHQWIQQWGVPSLLFVGFTPIPFELVTISSGVFQMNFASYLLAVFLGRSARYLLLAFLFWKFGPLLKEKFEKNVKIFAVGFTLAVIVGILLLKII